MTDHTSTQTGAERAHGEETLLPELVAHLRDHRTQLRQQWAERITQAQEAAARAAEAAQVASLEAEARRPLWQRIFRRRGRP